MKSQWKKIKCKKCGYIYDSHPNVFNEKRLDGLCIKCYHKKEKMKEDLTPRQMERLSEWMNEWEIERYLGQEYYAERLDKREYYWNGGIEL